MLKISKTFLLFTISAIISATNLVAFAKNNYNKEMKEDILIPREVLFGNPDKTLVRLSDDGKYIAYLAPLAGVLNVFIASSSQPSEAKPITNDRHRGVRSYSWAKNDNHIIYTMDNDGDENFRLYSIDIHTRQSTLLTPEKSIKASVLKVSQKFPDEILVKMNNRVPEYFDIYKINLKTGKSELIFENKDQYSNFTVDDDFNLRLAYKMNPNGEGEVFIFKDNNLQSPEFFQKIKAEDMLTSGPLHISSDGGVLYMIDSTDRNTAALYEINLATRERKLIYEDPRADIDDYIVDPATKKIQGVAVDYMVKEWTILDDKIKEDVTQLTELHDGAIEVISRTKKDDQWIVVYMQDDGPFKYYLYDRAKKEAKFLFVSNARLEPYKFAKMHPIKIKARDELDLVSYLTLPRWLDNGSLNISTPIPLILYVHGGPNARDKKGYDATHQWLANRGYAVLSVNYRGSTGFGKSFINAGDGQWARKMQTDLEDAVRWAIDQKITESDKVVIMGGSYGGYATLVGMTMTPDLYAAGIDIVGMSNLETFVSSIPPYWKPIRAHLQKMLGTSLEDEKGKEILKARSPITYAKNIKKPLLIVQGAHDPRVKQAESDQIVSVMKKHNIPVVYLLYKDEGHGLARPENRMSFFASAEIFLANILKGRYLKHDGNFIGSSMEIIEGKDLTWYKEVMPIKQ
jgi:dipeptidyl aminopeptidase/acylaminoacyl peptidase